MALANPFLSNLSMSLRLLSSFDRNAIASFVPSVELSSITRISSLYVLNSLFSESINLMILFLSLRAGSTMPIEGFSLFMK